MADRVKLTKMQCWILEKAILNPDGGRIRGPGKHRSARSLEKLGLAKLIVPANGLTSRVAITNSGRALLASNGKTD